MAQRWTGALPAAVTLDGRWPGGASVPLHKLRLANAAILSVALTLAAMENIAPAPVIAGPNRHWPTTQRDVAVIDRTGDDAWHAAIKQAVAAWGEPRSGADLRITSVKAPGQCTFEPGRISVCLATYAELERREGRASEKVGRNDHTTSAVVLLCGDCGLHARRKGVVATHEIGHALGLDHVARATSVMCPVGCAEVPDALDYQALRGKDDHVDPAGPSGPCRLARALRLRC